jgi:GLPGLI family protein
MKKLFFLFFITLNCFGQDKLVVYNFTILEDEKFLKDDRFAGYFKEGIEQAKHIKLDLEFNDTIARFKMQEKMNSDELKLDMGVALCSCKEEKFIYNNQIYRNNSEGIFEKDKFLIVDKLESNWTLTNDTKTIDGYECYKATTLYIVNNSKGEFRHPVTAWYCPQLPYSFGPAGYGGLPGLILELQEWNNVFGAEKIVLNHNVKQEIKLPTKGEVISYDNYNKKIGETYGDYLKDRESSKD